MSYPTSLGLRVSALLLAVLLAATCVDGMGYMMVEETCERHQVVPPSQPACTQGVGTYVVGVPYAAQIAIHQQPQQVSHHQHHGGSCSCGGNKHDGTCTCGGNKHDGTCTCGGNKHDGTCTCGKKHIECKHEERKHHECGCKHEEKKKKCEVASLAEEGISTLFKVFKGGMKMVEHIADSIKKKESSCGCKKPCGCGCACKKPACGCGCGGPAVAVPVAAVPVALACNCGCGH